MILKALKEYKFNLKDFKLNKKVLKSSYVYMSDNIYSLNSLISNQLIEYDKINENIYLDVDKMNQKEYNYQSGIFYMDNILSKGVFNLNYFGKLIVDCDRKVYTSMNLDCLGEITSPESFWRVLINAVFSKRYLDSKGESSFKSSCVGWVNSSNRDLSSSHT